MTREDALRKIREKAGELEDFLQGDEGEKTPGIADPTNANEELRACISGLQALIQWCAGEIAEIENEKVADEVYDEEKVWTLDEELMDRGLSRGM